METIIIIPTYNERENIKKLIPEILTYAPHVSILVVDDNSPDGTGRVVEEIMKDCKNVMLYARTRKEGLGVAYRSAILKVQSMPGLKHIITMDADGSHDPQYIPAILEALMKYDVVIGSRYVPGGAVLAWEKWRYLLSKYGNLYAYACTGIGISDLTAGFVGFRTSILTKMHFSSLSASGYAYQMEFKFNAAKYAKAQIIEVPIVFKNRREGESKISRHIVIEGLLTPIRLLYTRMKLLISLER